MRKFVFAFVALAVSQQPAHAQAAFIKNMSSKISATGQVITIGYQNKVADEGGLKSHKDAMDYSHAWDAAVEAKMTKADYNQCLFLQKQTYKTYADCVKINGIAISFLKDAKTALDESAAALVANDFPLAISKHADASKYVNLYSRARGFALSDSIKSETYHNEWRKILEKYPVMNQ